MILVMYITHVKYTPKYIIVSKYFFYHSFYLIKKMIDKYSQGRDEQKN